MSKKHLLTCVSAVGLGFAFAGSAQAQNIIAQFGSPDGAVALQYPSTVPNNAQPEAAIHNITGFDRTFGLDRARPTRGGPMAISTHRQVPAAFSRK